MTSTSRSARLAKWLSVPLGLVVSALLIWQASYAAFSDKTTTEGSLGAGTVSLVEERPRHTDYFEAKELAPGAPYQTATMRARYDGTLDADVSFYGVELEESTEGFAAYIELEISATPFGPGAPTVGPDPFFTGTLAEFHRDHGSFERGWQNPANMAVVAGYGAELEIKYRLDTETPNNLQGESVSIVFVGEAVQRPWNG